MAEAEPHEFSAHFPHPLVELKKRCVISVFGYIAYEDSLIFLPYVTALFWELIYCSMQSNTVLLC